MAEGPEDFAINWLVSSYEGGPYLHHTDVVLCCVPVSLQQPIQVSPSTECFPSTLQTKLFIVFNLLEVPSWNTAHLLEWLLSALSSPVALQPWQ